MTSTTRPTQPEPKLQGLAAIILAAGFSSRMGVFKPLLRVGNRSALERCIGTFHDAGITEVIVVLGHRGDELHPIAKGSGAQCVFNEHYEQGMYSSIVAGCRALPKSADAVFVLPVDMPLVRPTTVHRLAEAWASHHACIIYPFFEGRRGHPPLIARKILAEVSHGGSVGPLSAVLAGFDSDAVDLPVVDQAIHMDMDTPTDYEDLEALAYHRDIPTILECEAILASQSAKLSVVAHSYMVAEIACRIAFAIYCRGPLQNLDLVRAGALLHDIAKGQPDHAAVGASILRAMGFPKVAEIVGAHTDLDFSGFNLDESAIVYLADKLVSGERLVTIAERFAPALARFRNDPVALKAAQRRSDTANDVVRAIETRLGITLTSILNEDFGSWTHWSGTPFATDFTKL